MLEKNSMTVRNFLASIVAIVRAQMLANVLQSPQVLAINCYPVRVGLVLSPGEAIQAVNDALIIKLMNEHLEEIFALLGIGLEGTNLEPIKLSNLVDLQLAIADLITDEYYERQADPDKATRQASIDFLNGCLDQNSD